MKRSSAKHNTIRILLPILVFLVAAGVLLQTAAFHINPIKIGYHRLEYGSCVIYSNERTAAVEYEELKEALRRNEAAVGLPYKAKLQLILCKSQEEIGRYLPYKNQMERKNAGAFAPWPNTVYLTPKIQEKYGTIQGALTHECSHILLLQHYGLIKCTRLWNRAEWLPEGWAVFYAGWPPYTDKRKLKETIAIAKIDMMGGKLLGNKRPQEMMLPERYMIYYYFIEYLHRKYDASRLAGFLQKACSDPGRVESAFEELFGESISESIKDFAKSIGQE